MDTPQPTIIVTEGSAALSMFWGQGCGSRLERHGCTAVASLPFWVTAVPEIEWADPVQSADWHN